MREQFSGTTVTCDAVEFNDDRGEFSCSSKLVLAGEDIPENHNWGGIIFEEEWKDLCPEHWSQMKSFFGQRDPS